MNGPVARYGAVFLQIRLVSNNYQGHTVSFFDAKDLVTKFGEFVEGTEGGNGVDKKKALACGEITENQRYCACWLAL